MKRLNIITRQIRNYTFINNKSRDMERIRRLISEKVSVNNEYNKYYVELIHTYPAWTKISFRNIFNSLENKGESHSAANPWGHTAISLFRTENDSIVTDNVFNVGTNMSDGTMNRQKFMHKFTTDEYLFNSEEENKNMSGNAQNGLFERSFCTVSFEVTHKQWSELNDYYEELIKKTRDPNNKQIFHICGNLIPNFKYEQGNCCYWITGGLAKVGIMKKYTNFPLKALYTLLVNIKFGVGQFENNDKHCVTLYQSKNDNVQPIGTFYTMLRTLYNAEHWGIERKLKDITVSMKLNDSGSYDLNIKKENPNKSYAGELIDNIYYKLKSIVKR